MAPFGTRRGLSLIDDVALQPSGAIFVCAAEFNNLTGGHMKLKRKLKQSANNSLTRIIRDSSPKGIVGTLVKFMPACASAFVLGLISVFTLAFATGGNVYATDYTYSIIYDDNVVDNMPTDINSKTLDSTIPISSNIPTRPGYVFQSWNTLANGTGTSYNVGADLTIDHTTAGSNSNNYKLYAIWQSAPYMQDFTLADCQSKASDNNYIVMDKRDNNGYTVRYINGACWMTQNLRIAPGTHMTADDTNITTEQYNNDGYYADGYYALPGEGYDLKVDGASGGNCYADGASGLGYTNACVHAANDTDVSDVNYQYTKQQLGAWYNYAAATAGTIIGASNSDTDIYNVCPKGWTLPTNGTGVGQIGSIGDTYKDVFEPLHGGSYNQGSHYYSTTNGFWWSATARDVFVRYYLRYTPVGSLAVDPNNRYNGLFIRCVRTT